MNPGVHLTAAITSGGHRPVTPTADVVAAAASPGVPFVVGTPPDATVCGAGGVKASDLLPHGVILMPSGCLLVGLTGRHFLRLLGIP